MSEPNVLHTVPFLHVSDMKRSLAFYVDGLGFSIKHRWEPDGEIRWVWLEKGNAALMLQQFSGEEADASHPTGKVGEGVSIYFICQDALAIYRELVPKQIEMSEPQVGNGMWEFELRDPDGFSLHFESLTDVPEDTRLSEFAQV